MWLTFTCVVFEKENPKSKKQNSRIQIIRINMNFIETYFEAPEAMKNHESEQARCNTVMMIANASDKAAYHVKETVDEIDDMIAKGDNITATVPLEMKTAQEKINEAMKPAAADWGSEPVKSGW